MKPFCILLALLSFELTALTITPTVLEISTQPKMSAQIRLENTSSKQTPIEVSVRHLVFDDGGSFVVEDAENTDLVVFPPAAVLDVGGVQIFRLQWLGNASLPQSQSFFVRFTQPALEMPEIIDGTGNESGSALAIEIHYNALIHLSSPSQKPDLTLRVSSEGVATLTNRGDRYTFLSRFRFLHQTKHVLEMPETLFGERFIPPNTSVVLDSVSSVVPGIYVGESR
ncbi:hypothetical protein LRP49_12130 [Enterovibrio sp. ZSDZ35]|uniref:P pilus assembly protein, chaperone PapD n=1 Tax=Enterovibrio qingdaonensis TaxID=2899818 RepID=A0ABT5QLR5_9GAMM|nr:hypothetical protein [Enterovibrio sp. ZSDZ35]MDD1781922.1 hypothetical protein [Enterovibrio sp. ZSDZ35]